MKKDDLKSVMKSLRAQLSCDPMCQMVANMRIEQMKNESTALVDRLLTVLVESQGNYSRMSDVQLRLADQIGLSAIYSREKFHTWIHFWSGIRKLVENLHDTGSAHRMKEIINGATLTLFDEIHRRVVCFDDILIDALHTVRGKDELVIEGLSSESDPNINDIRDILGDIADLADAYSRIDDPVGSVRVLVTYLDMGSNWQAAIKVDGKVEVGPNLAKFLTQVFSPL
jgi:hypothetical protein